MKFAILICGVCQLGLAGADVVIDGLAASLDGYTTRSVQTLPPSSPNWADPKNALVNLRSVQEGNTLNVYMAGSIDGSGKSMLLFIDSKPGGISRIGSEQITILNENNFDNEMYINSLGAFVDGDELGMKFEDGFLPDYAIRIGAGNTGSRKAYVNRYDLVAGTFQICGEADPLNLPTSGFITNMRANWNAVGAVSTYASFDYGVEMALDLPALGVTGASTVKVMALLVDGLAYEGSHHVLGPLPAGSEPLGYDICFADFQAIAGTQTISIPVTGGANLDQDGDGLPDSVETNTGVYVSATDTGTNPNDSDSDDDGYPDGAEVDGTSALGYVSNPNIRNHTNMSVPGIFNLPTPWQANGALNSPPTAMTQVSNSLTGQYQWTLDYRFTGSQIGSAAHKFAAGGTSEIIWGAGETAGVAVPNGSDIPSMVAASGFHRFTFDQATLACSFTRPVFPNATAFLQAYGLTAGIDSDGDGILNENEFAANTDPTNPDSDGDSLNDSEANPLVYNPVPLLFAAWISQFATEHPSAGADPDADGFSNLKEFYFGTSPIKNQGNLLALERAGGTLILHWQQINSAGVAYHLQESTSLAGQSPWQNSPIVPVNDPDQTGVPTGYTRKQATIPAVSGKLFLRVSASE